MAGARFYPLDALSVFKLYHTDMESSGNALTEILSENYFCYYDSHLIEDIFTLL